MWERELRKIKGLYDNRIRASQQKSSKMEQALTNQTYQVSSPRGRRGNFSFLMASGNALFNLWAESTPPSARPMEEKSRRTRNTAAEKEKGRKFDVAIYSD